MYLDDVADLQRVDGHLFFLYQSAMDVKLDQHPHSDLERVTREREHGTERTCKLISAESASEVRPFAIASSQRPMRTNVMSVLEISKKCAASIDMLCTQRRVIE